MALIELTQHKHAIVDDDMFDVLNAYKWYAHSEGKTKVKKFYVKRKYRINWKEYWVYMHHAVIGRPIKKLVVDHINGDPLDNRRSNLRIVTHQQNMMNRAEHRSAIEEAKKK